MGKKMGKYCKAYYLSDFMAFPGWPGTIDYMRKEGTGGTDAETVRPLGDKDILYLQENYTVTDGIFLEDHVVFDRVTPEWIDFCTKTLAFEPPVFAQ